MLFIEVGTASVFLLRSRSLQSLTPATVGAYHNFIPILHDRHCARVPRRTPVRSNHNRSVGRFIGNRIGATQAEVDSGGSVGEILEAGGCQDYAVGGGQLRMSDRRFRPSKGGYF